MCGFVMTNNKVQIMPLTLQREEENSRLQCIAKLCCPFTVKYTVGTVTFQNRPLMVPRKWNEPRLIERWHAVMVQHHALFTVFILLVSRVPNMTAGCPKCIPASSPEGECVFVCVRMSGWNINMDAPWRGLLLWMSPSRFLEDIKVLMCLPTCLEYFRTHWARSL